MAGRWRDPTSFRADPAEAAQTAPSRRQALALVVTLLLVTGAVAAASFLIRPARARAFDLFSGSLFLGDSVAPVAVDLATGQPSVRLIEAATQVGASPTDPGALNVTPLGVGGGTLLLNNRTGEFNMADSTGFVIKRTGGVRLHPGPGSAAVGIPADDPEAPDLAYIEQVRSDQTAVYLVGQQTVRDAITAKAPKPRAAISMAQPGSTAPGAAAAADGHLWLLVGSGSRRTIRELSLPPDGQSYGATLAHADHGTVVGPAAIATATAGEGGTPVVGVASTDRIEVFVPGADPVVTRFSAPPGVDRILPATNGTTGRLAFLMHSAEGWSVVSVGLDGTGLRGPNRLSDVPVTDSLAPPAASNGSLYTIDRQSGQIVHITPDQATTGVPGAPDYPRARRNGTYLEAGGFYDAYVIARGSRVFIDSPEHREALALFTDGSHRPLAIQKSAAVGLNAAGDAATLTRSRLAGSGSTKPTKPPGGKPKPPQKPPKSTPISNTVDCNTTTQKPNIPQITSAVPGSRSVSLAWTYPRVGRDDCVPQTYVVQVKLLSNDAPPAPGSVTVSNQQSVNLVGLFPSSTYDVSVTAEIRNQSTSSRPVQIQTAKEGPAAPTNLRVRARSDGTWQVGWSACESVRHGCVPAQSWEVKPSICDGHGLVGQLPSLLAPADPTSRRQPAAIYTGGTGLLGRGLTFQVMGRAEDGTPGALSARTPCTYSWSPPIGSALRLTASTRPTTGFGTTTTANATLNLGSHPVLDMGGVGAQVTFTLSGDGAAQTKGPFTFDGTQSTLATTFAGIRPGAQYTVSASVRAGHGGPAVTVKAPQISTRADWPNYALHPTCRPGFLDCTLRVAIGGLSSAAARGEHFDLTSASHIVCGNSVQTLALNNFDPAQSPITADLKQTDGFYGQCTVAIQLVEDAPGVSPLVFGGTASPIRTSAVQLGRPQTANVTASDFDVAWNQQFGSSVEIRYTGSQDLGALTNDWTETVTAPAGPACSAMSSTKPPGSTDLTATYIAIPADCVNTHGSTDAWTVSVQFHNRVGGSQGGPFSYPLPGPPPGYQPCSPSGLTAAWGPTLADGIAVTVDSSAVMTGCSAWHYTLSDTSTTPPTQVCAVSTDLVNGNPPPVTINTTTCGTPPTSTWSLDIAWTDTAGNPQSLDVPLGSPPTS